MVSNVLSVDLEPDFRQQFDPRVVPCLLKLFAIYSVKTTFFIVGEIYDRYPQLIEKIRASGHEIGYHTHRHVQLTSAAVLINELKRSKKFIQRFHPLGFRAPRMFFKQEYFPTLAKYGFRYDSSTYDCFGATKEYAGIKELPVSLVSFWPYLSVSFPRNLKRSLIKGLPFGSGFFLSLFQKQSKFFINFLNRRQQPAIFFVHPWQMASYQPRGLYNIPRLIYQQPVNATMKYLLGHYQFVPLNKFL